MLLNIKLFARFAIALKRRELSPVFLLLRLVLVLELLLDARRSFI